MTGVACEKQDTVLKKKTQQNRKIKAAWQLPLPLERENDFSIDNLVVTRANAPVFDALASWPHWHNGVMLLIGETKTGKSHMASCWMARAFGRAFSPHQLESARQAATTGTPILVEDIAPGLFDETALFHLINSVHEARITHQYASLLMTTPTHPSLWNITLPDLASRLRAVQLLEMAPPDDKLLQAILTKLFADRQLKVEPPIIRYSVTRMERSIAAAVKFVTEIDQIALARKSKITLKLTGEILGQHETYE